jgi:SAM-dependent methyltransferase
MAQDTTAPLSYDDVWNDVYGDMQDVGPTHRHMRRMLKRILRELDYSSALEVGCGAGHNLPLLRPEGSDVSVAGLDISEEALRRARERFDANFELGDIQTDRLDGTWELVFSSLVLEHLPDDASALGNMRAMASRWLVVTTIAGDFERYRPWEEQMGHVRNYRRGELESKVEAAGFAVERSIYWGFPFYSPLARRLQNGMRSESDYSIGSRIAAEVMNAAYFLNSRRRGDLLLLVARAKGADG